MKQSYDRLLSILDMRSIGRGRWLLIVMGILLLSLIPQKAQAAQFGGGINAGLGVAPIPTIGFDGFYILNDLHLGLHLSQGNLDLSSLAKESSNVNSALTNIDKFDANAQLTFIEARYFLLLGINVIAGLGQRKVDFDYSISDITGGVTAGSIKTTSTVAKLGFGTMGRFGLFYVGFDLLGILTPLSSEVSSSVSTSLPTAGSDLDTLNQDLIDIGQDLGESTLYSVAMFSIGALL